MIKQIHTQGYDNNFSYLVGKTRGDVAVVDPSNCSRLEKIFFEERVTPTMILLTHSHFDHTEGANDLAEKHGIPVFIHKNGMGMIKISDSQVVLLDDNEEIRIGGMRLRVIHTPGHIEDAVCYYCDEGLITGDTVFVGAIGRADLEGGDIENLYNSIQKIKALPDETIIYPGHDYGKTPTSTIGREKRENPYFRCGSLEEFRRLRGA